MFPHCIEHRLDAAPEQDFGGCQGLCSEEHLLIFGLLLERPHGHEFPLRVIILGVRQSIRQGLGCPLKHFYFIFRRHSHEGDI